MMVKDLLIDIVSSIFFSGALNESFADIFGEMVEYYVEGGTLSWKRFKFL